MKTTIAALLLFSLNACVTPAPVDYTKFKASNPTSILILPPINHSIHPSASNDYLSVISRPIVEQGFYVFPVAVVDAYFRNHGISEPNQIHQTSLQDLGKAFRPDAILYLEIDSWGSSYLVLTSVTKLQVRGRLVDARDGTELWSGTHAAEEASGGGDSVGAMVAGAILRQIVNDISNAGKTLAENTANDHYRGGNGLLKGPMAENMP